jgi:hypothetical protein
MQVLFIAVKYLSRRRTTFSNLKIFAMAGMYFAALVSFAGYAVAQSGVDLDKPMLGGGGRRGPGAMLRFGCSQVSYQSVYWRGLRTQVVIERIDPWVQSAW